MLNIVCGDFSFKILINFKSLISVFISIPYPDFISTVVVPDFSILFSFNKEEFISSSSVEFLVENIEASIPVLGIFFFISLVGIVKEATYSSTLLSPKIRCVWQSTYPGITTLSEQSIS